MKYVKALIGIFLLICVDQYSKYLVVQKLEMYEYHPILGNIFGLFYLENKGMAWGMFQNRQVIFLILTVIILVVLAYCYVKLSKDTKFFPISVCIQFLAAGAIGNMIDRIFHGDVLFQGSVVDFLYIKIIDFPVFNIADMFVTGSVAVLVLLLLFRYKENDFTGVFYQKKAVTPEIGADDISKEADDTSKESENTMETDYEETEPRKITIDEIFNDENEEDDE